MKVPDFLDRFFSRTHIPRRKRQEMTPTGPIMNYHSLGNGTAKIDRRADFEDQLIDQIKSVPAHHADGIYYVDRRLPFGVANNSAVTLTTTQKNLWANGASNPCILPANYWTIGKTQRLTANFAWTAVANTNNITVGLQYGAADAAACNVISQAIAGISSTTTFDVIFQGTATCRLTGTSGTLSLWGMCFMPSGLVAVGILNYPVAGVTVVSTIDTTVGTNGLSFQALRATAGTDSIVATDIVLEAMN